MALPTVPPAASTRTKHASNSSLGSSFNPNYPPPAPSSTSNTAPSPSSNRPYSSSSASSSASSAVGPNPSSGNSYLNPQTSSGYAPVPTGQSASRLNPNWAAGPGPKRASSSTMGGGSGSSGSREGSDEIEMDETPPRTVAAGVGAVGGRGEVVEGVLSSRLGSAYGPYSYQSMPQHPSQTPLLSAPSPTGFPTSGQYSRFSGMSGLSSSPSQLSSYTAGAGSTVPFNDYPSSDHQSDTEKRYSMVPSLMGLNHRASSVFPSTPPAAMYMWDEKDPEMDDALHRPDPEGTKESSFVGWSWRGVVNLTAIAVLLACLLMLFLGYPILTEMRNQNARGPAGTFNLGGINGSGQVPNIPNLPSLIDPDTPANVYSRVGFDGKPYNLVFSDEFETDGRSFYPGDDPFWEGMDFHYWATVDYEWYSPRAITTQGGHLVLTMTERESHGLNFESGMLQSWNKFCFTRGYVEVSVALPGNNKVGGYWPGVWLMGNLGRPGYGASTEGTWPYSYDSCDVGTSPNQTYFNKTGPADALNTGYNGGELSFLPGQKLSACTCKGQDHPGPNVGVGRGAPEIDILEAQVDLERELGQMSQSAQFAPYDSSWQFDETGATIYNPALTKYNGYLGGHYQQAVSGLVYVDTAKAYGGNFQSYGVEFWSDKDDPSAGYITWQVDDVASWKMDAEAIKPNAGTGVGQRLVSVEPMSIVFNFGMSDGFQAVNFANLQWPAEVRVDYIRVYQVEGEENIGCDPKDFPTADYIDKHLNAYSNPNLTIWKEAGYDFPRNSQYDGC